MPIVGEVKDVLRALIDAIKDTEQRMPEADLKAWWDTIEVGVGKLLGLRPQQQRCDQASNGGRTLWEMTATTTCTSPQTWAASNVGCPVLPLRSTAALDHSGGLGTMALAFRMPWASNWPTRQDVFASPAKVRANVYSRAIHLLQYNTPIKVLSLTIVLGYGAPVAAD